LDVTAFFDDGGCELEDDLGMWLGSIFSDVGGCDLEFGMFSGDIGGSKLYHFSGFDDVCQWWFGPLITSFGVYIHHFERCRSLQTKPTDILLRWISRLDLQNLHLELPIFRTLHLLLRWWCSPLGRAQRL
jgi:hypothetical protein